MRSSSWQLLLCIALLAACGHAQRLRPEGGFTAEKGREHPLAGKIWSRAAGAFISVEALETRVRQAPILLIGESHDHVDHHQLEAWLLARWLDARPGPAAVAFEMLDEEQAPKLVPPPPTADALAEQVGWSASGWPDFALYRPVFEVALARGARIVAAHPSRARVRASMAGVGHEEAKALMLDLPLPEGQREELAREIAESHCGHAPPAMVEAMVTAQSFKDAWMARALVEAARPAALIAGRGHIDEVRGVPLFLARRGRSEVLTVALREVEDGRERATDYTLDRADLTLFTPRMDDADACARFREQLEKMRKHPAPPHAEGQHGASP